jgi:hypothetical protein
MVLGEALIWQGYLWLVDSSPDVGVTVVWLVVVLAGIWASEQGRTNPVDFSGGCVSYASVCCAAGNSKSFRIVLVCFA